MKIICQLGVLFAVCWVSQIIESLLPFAFPASVISMLLLLLLLLSGRLKLDSIRETADLLLANMSFFFLPAGVSMMNYFDVLKSNGIPLLIICLVTMVLVFAATTLSIKLTLRLMERGKRHG